MWKKRWIVAGATMFALTGLVFAFGWMMMADQQVTDATVDAIEIGMPIKTVESILGRKAAANTASIHSWSGDDSPEGTLIINVAVDAQDRVIAIRKSRRHFHPVDRFMLGCFPSWIF